MFNAKHTYLDLERIDVASPCSANWEVMSGDDRSRLCSQCDLLVHNISGLTRTEVSDLIGNREGRICVRLHRRPDGTILTRDCPKGLREYRIKAARFAGSFFAAILGLFSVNFGQRSPVGNSQGIRSESTLNVASIQGTVRDATGEAIPNAAITVTTSNGKTISRKTDQRGRFQLTSFALEAGTNKLKVEALGFSSFRDEFTVRRTEMIDYPIILDAGHMVGVVEIRSEPLIDPKKSGTSTTIRFGDN